MVLQIRHVIVLQLKRQVKDYIIEDDWVLNANTEAENMKLIFTERNRIYIYKIILNEYIKCVCHFNLNVVCVFYILFAKE